MTDEVGNTMGCKGEITPGIDMTRIDDIATQEQPHIAAGSQHRAYGTGIGARAEAQISGTLDDPACIIERTITREHKIHPACGGQDRAIAVCQGIRLERQR